MYCGCEKWCYNLNTVMSSVLQTSINLPQRSGNNTRIAEGEGRRERKYRRYQKQASAAGTQMGTQRVRAGKEGIERRREAINQSQGKPWG